MPFSYLYNLITVQLLTALTQWLSLYRKCVPIDGSAGWEPRRTVVKISSNPMFSQFLKKKNIIILKRLKL